MVEDFLITGDKNNLSLSTKIQSNEISVATIYKNNKMRNKNITK